MRKKRTNQWFMQHFAGNQFKILCEYTDGLLWKWNIWFSTEINRNLDQFLCILCKINACVHRMTYTNFHIRSQKPQKTTSKCNIDSIWPVCQLWSVILDCVRDSDLKRYFHKHKSLKIALETRNEEKTHKSLIQTNFAGTNNKYSCKSMQSRVCKWNIWFSTEINRNLDQFLCILSKINACVHRMTYTNFHIRSQKPQKTTSKCNIDSIWPVCQLWSVILDCVRDSDLKRYFHKHKSLKIALETRNEEKTHKSMIHATFCWQSV